LKLQYFPNFNEFTHKSTPSKMTDDNVHALEGFASGSCHRPQADNTMHDTRQYDDLQLDWILPADLKIASAHRQDALLVDCGDCRERNLQKLTPPHLFSAGLLEALRIASGGITGTAFAVDLPAPEVSFMVDVRPNQTWERRSTAGAPWRAVRVVNVQLDEVELRFSDTGEVFSATRTHMLDGGGSGHAEYRFVSDT
jgi:hypothetical protein